MDNKITLIELDETVSTNSFLATYQAANPAAITVVTAEYQSAGRGQTGNSWESERGKNLLFSILMQPVMLPATHVFMLSEAIALSIREAIVSALNLTSPLLPLLSERGALPVTVKWPNDIYVGNSKIAGILIENTLCGQYVGRSIIGCGVNINQQTFISDAPNPVSLRQLIGHDSERRPILEHIIEAFRCRMESLNNDASASLHADYLASLYHRTGLHPFRDVHGSFDAAIADVAPSGHLVLRDMDGALRRYAFKEVEYVHATTTSRPSRM